MRNPEGISPDQSIEGDGDTEKDKSIPEGSEVTRQLNGDLHITFPDAAYSQITIKPNGSVYWGDSLEEDSEVVNAALEYAKIHSYKDTTPGRHDQKESYVG